MNNNEPETIPATVRPLARSAAAGMACLLAASWGAPASANVVTEFNAIALTCLSRPGPGPSWTSRWRKWPFTTRFRPSRSATRRIAQRRRARARRPAAAAAAAYRVLSDNRICAPPAAPAVDPQVALDALFKPYLDGNDPGLAVGYAAADRMLLEIRGTTTTTRCHSTAALPWGSGARRRPPICR